MALEGSLTDFGLADILQLIYFQRKTGVLTLEGKMDKVSLLFIDGNIGGAESKRRMADNRLGKILLKKGLVKEEDLETALEEQRKTNAKLGNILIRTELVEKEVIQDIVQGQITETIIQLFGWKQGTYEFAAQKVSPDKDLPFSLDTQHLLMEGLRIVDEWSVIQGKITLDSLFRKRVGTPSGLTEEELEVFSFVDGENDVSTIIDLSGQDNFEVSKTLLSLLEKGCIETAETAPVIREEPAVMAKPSPNLLGYLPYIAIILSFCLSLAGVFMQNNEDLKNFSASRMIDSLRMKIEVYQLEHAAYPSTLDQITQAKDSWGRPYIYRNTADSFSIASAGADGIEGTKDDIY
ncbi:MAG: hypothetical protein H6Q93_563 [Nitrospirae bacterium]|nr:hypothetical protein [Nitrospirota bacterium]